MTGFNNFDTLFKESELSMPLENSTVIVEHGRGWLISPECERRFSVSEVAYGHKGLKKAFHFFVYKIEKKHIIHY